MLFDEHDENVIAKIVEQINNQIEVDLNEVVYSLTWEDVIHIMALRLIDDGIPVTALHKEELETMLTSGSNISLPWRDAVDFALDGKIVPCRFDLHDPDGTKTNTYYTTTLFWLCTCEADNIRVRTDMQCAECGIGSDDCADADVSTIFQNLGTIPTELADYFRTAWKCLPTNGADCEIISSSVFDNYALSLEKKALDEQGTSVSWTGIAACAQPYIVELRFDSTEMFLRPGWRAAMRTANGLTA